MLVRKMDEMQSLKTVTCNIEVNSSQKYLYFLLTTTTADARQTGVHGDQSR